MSKPGTFPRDQSLDARLCAEVGAELRRVRSARGLTIAEVGERLLLSPRQVRALEEVEFAAFHNPIFHLTALKKYVLLAELDSAWQYRLAAVGAKTNPGAAHQESAPYRADVRRWLLAAGVVVVAVVLVGALAYRLWARHGSEGATPRRVSAARSASSATGSATPRSPIAAAGLVASAAPGDAAPGNPAGFGSLKAVRPTWIFLRDADNTTTERSLAAGESLELESQPIYLVVGAADVELTIAGSAVDVSRFTANGEVRIGPGDFDALAQGASPIPAPTRSVAAESPPRSRNRRARR